MDIDVNARVDLLRRLDRFTSDDDEASPTELATRFLPRPEFAQALDPRIVILRGDRGAGKTSLFRVATSVSSELIGARSWLEGFADAVGHPAGDTIEGFAAQADDRTLRAFWLTHLAGRLLHHLPQAPTWLPPEYQANPAQPVAWLVSARDNLERVQAGLDATESALARAGDEVTVAYDHLDRIGVTNPDVRVRASSALMAIWLSFSSRYRHIRGKLFLRNDLFAAGLSRSADASKLETRSIDLEWTTQDLYKALLRRFGADEELRGWATRNMGRHILEDTAQGWMPPAVLPLEGRTSQKTVADAIVGEIMGSGVKKGYTY